MSIGKNLFENYQSYHTKKMTKLTHLLGVPCIVFSLQLLLACYSIPLLWYSLAGLLIFYLFIDLRLTIYSGLFLTLLTILAQACVFYLPAMQIWPLLIFLFIFGWIVQLIGHRFEGNKPAILNNLLYALVAPLFIVAEFIS